MIINHNLASMNALYQLNLNNNALQNALAQLSSGKRINSAADDAAGLAISQKMEGQINGLDQASRNAQDGISLIQTAEGALNETQSILQRMRQLADQSANDTNTDADRAQIQQEMDQLSEELSRIGNTTQFNTKNLLDGSFTGTFQIGANEDQNITLSINDMRGFALGVAGKVGEEESATVSNDNGSFTAGTYYVVASSSNYNLVDSTGKVVATSTDSGKTYVATADTTGADTLTFTDAVTSGEITIAGSGSNATATGYTQVDNLGLQAGTYTLDVATTTGGVSLLKDSNGNVVATSTDGQNFTAGTVTLFTLKTAATTDTTIKVGGIDVSSQKAANSAITTIDKAIQTVSTERAKLGAYENRLQHTINNLSTSSQNLTAASSRITDVDMAQEMAEFTKDNVLAQAATSMLAQANQQPQLVLKLLG
ncbi:MAG: flagellin [Alicyclobacillus herbarius]|uniref:flagellin N-terminal helical domain-containing protein n=1 Tax=Alicyclobacillus herbarius TaxID=122960 RepID=UPI00235638E7|nr:flagellin [Alicyclobacillus herbarius]MCL6632364.1 flagellin [Alicyclobacillus herbarius]